MRIKKGDFVRVIAGKHKATEGQVVKIDHQSCSVFLEEIKVKKHQKPTQEKGKGQIVEIHWPVHVSNVMALDPRKKVLTRIGYKFKDNRKLRFAKKTGEEYPN